MYSLVSYVDFLNAPARMQRDAVDVLPGERIEEDVVRLVTARQHTRKKDTVVIPAGLLTEDRHVKTIPPSALDEILDQSRTGHTVPNHDEPLFHHHVF
jgi:ribosomal protein L18E